MVNTAMGHRTRRWLISYTCALIFALPALAVGAFIDFEGPADGTPITNQYPGLIFSHATAIQAGGGLNEIEFPPHSGSNAAFDDGGAMELNFSSPIQSFDGFVTYLAPLTLTAFDVSNAPLGSVHSLFSNNTALSGVAGSTPDERLAIAAAGIRRIEISGFAPGSSFVIDDISTAVPEPDLVSMLGLAVVLGLMVKRRSAARRASISNQ